MKVFFCPRHRWLRFLPGLLALLYIQYATAADMVWFDDSLPDGSSALGDEPWTRTSNNPTPYSGASAYQTTLASGLHEHGFNFAFPDSQLSLNAGDTLFTFVYIDPTNLPDEIMLSFNTTDTQNSWD